MTNEICLAKCERCGREVPEDECIEDAGQVICEGCYMEGHQRIKICDPWAVRSKTIFRKQFGLEGTEGLTDLQKKIYEFVRSRGGATGEEIAREFCLSPQETENQFAILRHCELVKGQKREDGVYVVPFQD